MKLSTQTLLATCLVLTLDTFVIRVGTAQELTGSIAYRTFDDKQIRLVNPDGSDDQLLWEVPDPSAPWTLTGGPSWSPDGSKIAFTSDFDIARSLYQSDLYTLHPDGTNLKRITNGPNPESLDNYPKGSVSFSIVNFLADQFTYFIYVAGAPEVLQVSLSPNTEYNITIEDVADFGPGVNQFVTVHAPPHTWVWPATYFDVKENQNVNSPSRFEIANTNKSQDFGAYGVTWSSNSQRIGYRFTRQAALYSIAADPPINSFGDDVFNFPERPDQISFFNGIVFSPLASEPNKFLYLLEEKTENLFEDIFQVYLGELGDTELSAPLVNGSADNWVLDLSWLPDGSGFLLTVATGFLENSTIYKYDFNDGLSEFLTIEGTRIGNLSFSPDGEYIVFDRVTGFGEFFEELGRDIWIMRKDGSGQRLLIENAEAPSWGRQVSTSVEPDLQQNKSGYDLSQNYPNPFNESTQIEYTIPRGGHVSLKLVDIQGKVIEVLVNELKAGGKHRVAIDKSSLGIPINGLYLYQIEVKDGTKVLYTATQKMLME